MFGKFSLPLTCIREYFQVQDMKCVCSRRASRGIQSTRAQPSLPSRGHGTSCPRGSALSQNEVFMSINVGLPIPVRCWASSAKSPDSRYRRLTPALSLCSARNAVNRFSTSFSSTPRRRSLATCLPTVPGKSSHKSLRGHLQCRGELLYTGSRTITRLARLTRLKSQMSWYNLFSILAALCADQREARRRPPTKQLATPTASSGKCHQTHASWETMRGKWHAWQAPELSTKPAQSSQVLRFFTATDDGPQS